MTKKKKVEIFKALRIIITIMLCCAKTKLYAQADPFLLLTTTEIRKKKKKKEIKTTISLSTLG